MFRPSASAAPRCPACGAANQPYAAFCVGCGEPLAPDTTPAPAPEHADRRLQLLVAAGIVVIVGWMLLGWWQDDNAAARYRAGTRAQAAHDWAGAAGAYGAAGNYADAPARATAAAHTATERARLLAAADSAVAARDWAATWTDLTQALALDPTDPNLQARRAAAQAQMLDTALAGTLYRIADGPRAGLYANLAGHRDTRLPGSDGRSVPRAWSADGTQLVYDRPGPALDSSGPGATVPREAVLATFHPYAADPVAAQVLPEPVYAAMSGGITPGGLFWQTYSADDGVSEGSLVYYRFVDGQTVPVFASGQWRYVAATNAATGLVLQVVPPLIAADPALTHLTVGVPGAPLVLDTWQSGWLMAASFSADGRYLLFTMQNGSSLTSLSTSLFFADLRQPTSVQAPRVGVEFLQSITSRGPNPPTLSGAFVPNPRGAPTHVLVLQRDGTREDVTLRGLADGLGTSVWHGTVPAAPSGATLADDGTWLAYMISSPAETRLALQSLDANSAPLLLSSAGFRSGPTSLTFAPGSRFLLYHTAGPETGQGEALYSLPLARVDMSASGTPPLHPVYLGTMAADTGASAVALAPSGTFILYLDTQHQLHAVSYDGTIDIPLPEAVAGVWSLRP